MKRIEGGTEKVFVVVNTTNYNNDGNYSVIVCKFCELPELGFDDMATLKELNDLTVDEVATTDFVGCYIMRIA